MVIWITGLSGAGKSTLGTSLRNLLRQRGLFSLQVDGDALRQVVAEPSTRHDPASRLANAYRISRAARCLEDQGVLTVVSTMSLFREIHAWNRQHYEGYLEVLLKADREVLRQRHPSRLYDRATSGQERWVVGHDLEPEEPENPDLVLENDHHREDLEELAHLVLARLAELYPDWEERQRLRQGGSGCANGESQARHE